MVGEVRGSTWRAWSPATGLMAPVSSYIPVPGLTRVHPTLVPPYTVYHGGPLCQHLCQHLHRPHTAATFPLLPSLPNLCTSTLYTERTGKRCQLLIN